MIRELLRDILNGSSDDESLMKRIVDALDGFDDAGVRFDGLSKRNREIAVMLAKGYKSSEISDLLELSRGTIDTIRQQIYARLNIDSLQQLAVMAYRAGLLGDANE